MSRFEEDDADIIDIAVEALIINSPKEVGDYKNRLKKITDETYNQ